MNDKPLKHFIIENLLLNNETWEDVVGHGLTKEQLYQDHSESYDYSYPSFVLWTQNYVYSFSQDSWGGTLISIRLPRNPEPIDKINHLENY